MNHRYAHLEQQVREYKEIEELVWKEIDIALTAGRKKRQRKMLVMKVLAVLQWFFGVGGH